MRCLIPYMDGEQPRDGKSDASLVAAARKGDVRAFERLYDRHAGRVYRTAVRLLGERTEAEDVVQDVFVRLHRRPDAFDGRSAFSTWLYRVTVNACYDRMRKAQRRRAYHGPSLDADPVPACVADGVSGRPALSVMQTDFEQCVEQALAALHPDLRATLILKEMEGLSYREIERVLGCSSGTVASRLARARRQVAERLRAAGIDETYFDPPL